MKKTGFTLIELLAVIAILAILVVIAVPTVLQLFQDAKKNTFVTQAQEIFKAAEQQYISDQIGGTTVASYCFDGAAGANTLDLSGSQTVKYEITFTSDSIATFAVSDSAYGVNLAASPTIDGIGAATVVIGSFEGDIDCDD